MGEGRNVATKRIRPRYRRAGLRVLTGKPANTCLFMLLLLCLGVQLKKRLLVSCQELNSRGTYRIVCRRYVRMNFKIYYYVEVTPPQHNKIV